MSGETVKIKNFAVIPMMADGATSGAKANTTVGVVVATTTTPQPVDLATVPGLISGMPTPANVPGSDGINVLGNFVTIEAQTVDHFVIFGPTLLSVTGGNVPAPAAANTINGSGVVTPRAGTCMYIPAGTTQHYLLPLDVGTPQTGGPTVNGALAKYGLTSPCRFMSVVTGAATGFIRLWQSNPAT